MASGELGDPEGLSERLVLLLEPFRYLLYGDVEDDLEAYGKLLPGGVVAWNLAALPEQARGPIFERFIAGVAPGERELTSEFLKGAIERKLELYPRDARFIREANLARDGENFQVIVASVSRE